jgi:hypothetical protein
VVVELDMVLLLEALVGEVLVDLELVLHYPLQLELNTQLLLDQEAQVQRYKQTLEQVVVIQYLAQLLQQVEVVEVEPMLRVQE